MIKLKILFVCLGNICRSPTAEGVFRKLCEGYPQLKDIEIDSCGTSSYHHGEPPDPRTTRAAYEKGYDLKSIRSRKLKISDLIEYNYIIAMDRANFESITALASNNDDAAGKLSLFTDYSSDETLLEVPDPYYGGVDGFNDVVELIEDASNGLIETLLKHHC